MIQSLYIFLNEKFIDNIKFYLSVYKQNLKINKL